MRTLFAAIPPLENPSKYTSYVNAFTRAIVAVGFAAAIAHAPIVQAESCPDYDAVTSAPSLNMPSQKSFRKFRNRILSWFYSPFHMVHDQIIREGSYGTMVGKFDYDLVLHKDLEYEYVHTYIYGSGSSSWQYLGRYQTNSDGKIYVSVPPQSEGDYVVKMVVEGDLSVATGYLTVVKPGRETVLFDIDGTLTLNDFEAVGEYFGVDDADTYAYATELVQSYVNKGYQVVYLTGRPYWVSKSTRHWFDENNLFPWHLRMNANSDNLLNMETQQYKTDYINYLKNTVGLNIIRAYGNADTDIGAYALSGIPKAETYIIGQNAGDSGTQPIYGDYGYHYNTVANATPAASCTWP